tara:strand:- start:2134 stop:2565 length:432 start_codon:yes stop_codon:yes gene_type:complete
MSKKKEPPKSAEVIKGPWPNSSIKVPDIDGLRLIEELNFADHLTEGIMVQLIETMKENNIDVNNSTFLSDIGFVIEAVKAVIYRSMGHSHPLQEVMGNLINMTEIKNGEDTHVDAVINVEILEDVSDFITAKLEDDDNDPKIS